MIVGIVIAHGSGAEAFLNALRMMYGEAERLYGLSNEGLSTNDLSEKIRETASSSGEGEVCLFVDVFGGSCWRAAKMARLPGSAVITGFNLPMLLSFVSKRKTVPFEDIVAILETDGKRGITLERTASNPAESGDVPSPGNMSSR